MKIHFLPISIFVMFIGLTTAFTTWAEEKPNVGLLYNTKETHSISYHCSQTQDGLLHCDFIQTAVRKKATPDNLNTKIKQARDEFKREAKITNEECKSYKELVDILEDRKKPPKEDGLKHITSMEKQDLLKGLKAMAEFCKTRTEDSFLNVVRIGHEKDARTCLVSSQTFQQTFKLIQDDFSETKSWVTQSNPEGPCGVVQLSRFEPDKIKDSKLVFWRYVARKAVTNPQGTFFPGASCKGLDEGEYIYDWRSKEHSIGCDYVEFSPI